MAGPSRPGATRLPSVPRTRTYCAWPISPRSYVRVTLPFAVLVSNDLTTLVFGVVKTSLPAAGPVTSPAITSTRARAGRNWAQLGWLARGDPDDQLDPGAAPDG